MSAQAAALSKSWQCGRYTATLTVPPVANGVLHASIEWFPHMPRDLTPEELEAYRAGRNAAFKALGLSALVIEI